MTLFRIVLILLIFCFSSHAYAHPLENTSYSYSYMPHKASDDSPATAEINVETCDNVIGEIRNIKGNLIYQGKFYCLPYLRNVNSRLSTSELLLIDSGGISFNSGLILLPEGLSHRAELRNDVQHKDMDIYLKRYPLNHPSIVWVPLANNFSGQIYKIDSLDGLIGKNSFQITATHYSSNQPITEKYKVVFWDQKLPYLSLPEMQSRIIFAKPGYGFALEGGFAFRQVVANKFIPKISELLMLDEGLK